MRGPSYYLSCLNWFVERDREGIVAKHGQSRYTEQARNPAWIKIKNRYYSQIVGRARICSGAMSQCLAG